MSDEMSDENDLEEFARLFGAHPETPPEGLLPAAEARATPPAPTAGAAGAGTPGDPLAWLLSDAPAAPSTALPTHDASTAAFAAGELFPPATSYPTSGYPNPAAFPPQTAEYPEPAAASSAPTAVFPNPTAALPQPPAAYPAPTAAFADPAAAFPTVWPTAPADPTQVLPTRRSVAAEAAQASRETGRRNLIILGSIGALVLVLIVVLIVVLASKYGSSGSPDALLTQPSAATGTSSATPSATPTPTPTATETPTPSPTPTPTQTRTVAPPPPSPPTVTATVTAQPTCTAGATTTISIGYTSANAATLYLTSSDGAVKTNITPAASGTISSVLYHCDANPSYTLTVYSTGEGVTPVSTTVTPVPTS